MSRKINAQLSTLAYQSLLPKISLLPDAAGWQSTCRSLVERHIRRGQPLERVAEHLGLDNATAADLVSKAKPSIEGYMANAPGAYIGALLCAERDRPRANTIGRAMYDLFRRGLLARYFARDVVLQYSARAKQSAAKRGWEVRDDIGYARLLVDFVYALALEDLAIGLTLRDQCEIGSAAVKEIQHQLKLPQNPRFLIERTRRSRTGTRIGIEVVQCIGKTEVIADRAFRSAILLAEIFEPWSFSSVGRGLDREANSSDQSAPEVRK